MVWPRFTRTLHFRMSALFLVLLSLAIGGYYLWIKATVFSAYENDAEKTWYEDLAEPQLKALADSLRHAAADSAAVSPRLRRFRDDVREFGVELAVYDAAGRVAASAPDSLALAVPVLDAGLLAKMTADDWDFSSYPLPHDIEAFENRIFAVEPLAFGEAEGPPAAFLVASYAPLTVGVDDLTSDWRHLGIQALVLILLYAAVTALVVMAWASRRIRHLTRGVALFASGRFDHRVPDRSADEIGSLGRHFNGMAARIQTMVQELSAKEQFQRQLIANISHDLRTPLASLRGYVETLSYDPANLTTQEKRHYLQVIAHNLDHLDRLIEHTLILSRLDSGQTALRLEDFPVAELADSVLQRCAALAERTGVTLSLAIEAECGQVRADALQVGRVLQNLIENGIKFNRPGGSVTVSATAAPAGIRVRVVDDGPGIAAEDLPHIFERFYTGDKSRSRQQDGFRTPDDDPLRQSSGLGLAIAAKILEAHGRTLEVATVPGEGTTFTFDLPAAPQDDPGLIAGEVSA